MLGTFWDEFSDALPLLDGFATSLDGWVETADEFWCISAAEVIVGIQVVLY